MLSISMLLSIFCGQGIESAEATDWNVPDSKGYYTKWRSGTSAGVVGTYTVNPNASVTFTHNDLKWRFYDDDDGGWWDAYMDPKNFNYTIPNASNKGVLLTGLKLKVDYTLNHNNGTTMSGFTFNDLSLIPNSYSYNDYWIHSNFARYNIPNVAGQSSSYIRNGTYQYTASPNFYIDSGVLGRIEIFPPGSYHSYRSVSAIPYNMQYSIKITVTEITYIVFDYYWQVEVTDDKRIIISLITNVPRQTTGYNNRPNFFSLTATGPAGGPQSMSNVGAIAFNGNSGNANWSQTYTSAPLGSVYELTFIKNGSAAKIHKIKIIVPTDAYESLEAAEAAKKAAEDAKQKAQEALDKAEQARLAALAALDKSEQARLQALEASLRAEAARLQALASYQETLAIQSEINATRTSLEQKIQTNQTNLQEQINNLSENLSTEIHNATTNIHMNLPPTIAKISGYNNATATITGVFRVAIDYNNGAEYRVKIGEGEWSHWNSLAFHDTAGYISTSGYNYGANTIYIEIRNKEDGSVARGRMTVFYV